MRNTKKNLGFDCLEEKIVLTDDINMMMGMPSMPPLVTVVSVPVPTPTSPANSISVVSLPSISVQRKALILEQLEIDNAKILGKFQVLRELQASLDKQMQDVKDSKVLIEDDKTYILYALKMVNETYRVKRDALIKEAENLTDFRNYINSLPVVEDDQVPFMGLPVANSWAQPLDLWVSYGSMVMST